MEAYQNGCTKEQKKSRGSTCEEKKATFARDGESKHEKKKNMQSEVKRPTTSNCIYRYIRYENIFFVKRICRKVFRVVTTKLFYCLREKIYHLEKIMSQTFFSIISSLLLLFLYRHSGRVQLFRLFVCFFRCIDNVKKLWVFPQHLEQRRISYFALRWVTYLQALPVVYRVIASALTLC